MPRSSLSSLAMGSFCLGALACTQVPKPPPTRAMPAKAATRGRDGRGPWSNHHDALAWLGEAKSRPKGGGVFDIPLPDASNWSWVDFMGLRSVEAWRYENSDARYHAAVAAVAYASKNPSLDECTRRFAKTARATAKKWDFLLGETRLEEVPFVEQLQPTGQSKNPPVGRIARIYALDVVGRSLFGNKHYAAAFGVYPAWEDACFVVAVFVPVRGEHELAAALRDRLVKESLARVHTEPNGGKQALERSAEMDE